jgi:O-antigen/teichoic acid export membrane protein
MIWHLNKLLTQLRARAAALTGHQDFRLVAGNTLGVLVAKIVGSLVLFLVQIPLTRILGVTQYGTYVYVWSWLMILTTFVRLGLDIALVKYVPIYIHEQAWPRLKGLLGIAFAGPLALALALTAVIAALLHFSNLHLEPFRTYFGIAALLLLTLPANQMLQAALRGLKLVILSEIAESLAKPFFMFVFFLLLIRLFPQGGAANVLWAQLCVILLAIIVLGYSFFRKAPEEIQAAKADIAPAADWLRFSLPMLLLAGFSVITSRADIVLLGLLRGPADAGVYSIASRMADFTTFGLVASNNIVAPMISELYHRKDQHERLQGVLRVSAWFIFFFTLAACIGLAVVVPFLLPLFGPDFAAAYLPMLILLGGQMTNGLAGPVGFLLAMTGHQNDVIKVMLVAALLNIIGNAAFIPHFGTMGAALVTSGCILFWNVVLFVRVRRTLHLNPTILPL